MKLPKNLPQIRSFVANLFIILLGAPCLGVGVAFFGGEIHSFADVGKALNHGLLAAVCMAFGWIGMESPVGRRLRTILASMRTDSGIKTEVSVTGPVVDAGKSTITIDPTTSKVTVKEEPAATPKEPQA